MNFFEQHKIFVEDDNRKDREFHPVTVESLNNRHETMAPKWLVEGSTILDLGSCIGATGHWCLSQGATHYTGVEVQSEYVEKSNKNLAMFWDASIFEIVPVDIEVFLDTCPKKFDVVFVCGVIYGFLNTHGILEKICNIANKCVVIDTSYPTTLLFLNQSVIDITTQQHMIKDNELKTYHGLGSRPSPVALQLLMSNLGFETKEKILFPKQLSNLEAHDSYHSPIVRKHGVPTPAKYIMRFFKSQASLKSAGQALLTRDDKYVTELADKPITYKKVQPWVFDDSVASRFQDEAVCHIPDYVRVITMSLDIVKLNFKDTNVRIIDVGSALGYTVDKFLTAGYVNTVGLEISASMIKQSLHKDKIILSDTFPDSVFDVVLANWTLHFILERKEYIKKIFNQLSENGILVLSDKMTQSYSTKEMYYAWKESNGISKEEILSKERKLLGVLETKSLDWYIEILRDIGFKDIECVNGRFNFNTLLCKK
jgi:SAM-dependent methyltransferase/precorrin-6B methylase 2